MNGATTIQERLKDLRLNKGLKLEELAEQTGISKSALGSYEKDDFKEINHGNLILLADFYGVSLDYLFCRSENRTEINTPLRELHLSDEMVALLKNGRINNRLLCELATHKDFIKFLADIEIYVDGIATMQIQNLNTLVDTVRHEIIERYRPGEDDPHLKVLQAAHISDDEYFSHMVLDDLNPVSYTHLLGVYLPLITTNCAVLGVAITNVQKEYGILTGIVNGFATALGFTIAIVILAGLREKMEYNEVPESFKGMPMVLLTAGLMAIAFCGFSGLI